MPTLTGRRGGATSDRAKRAIDDATMRLVLEHGSMMLRVARRYSVCATDAEDAYQRGLEILLTKAPNSDPSQLVPWLCTVVKHEAIAIGKARRREDGAAFHDAGDRWASRDRGPDQLAEDYTLLDHGAEALGRLKPDEARCLLLKAESLTYRQIAEVTGFTYTKVNRCLTEGRQALRVRMGRIAGGEECARLEPMIARFVDGEADSDERAELAPHLEHCRSCRATVRDFHAAPARAAALFPPIALAADRDSHGALRHVADTAQSALSWIHDRLLPIAQGGHQWAEVAGAKKVVLVAAVTASIAAGGAAVEQQVVKSDDAPATEQRPGDGRDGTDTDTRPITPPVAITPKTDPDGDRGAGDTKTPRAGDDPDPDRDHVKTAADAVGPDATGGQIDRAPTPAPSSPPTSTDPSSPPSTTVDSDASAGSGDLAP